MIFVRTLQGRTLTLEAESCSNVLSIKNKIAEIEGLPVEDQRILHNGAQLDDEILVEDASTLHISLRLLGGGKKRKKKVYTTPKRIAHKKKKVKLSVLKYYEVDGNGKIKRLRKECHQCGGGVFMAAHHNRHYCGRCHDTLMVEAPPAPKAAGGAKAPAAKGKGKK